jgi:hypothetical protein
MSSDNKTLRRIAVLGTFVVIGLVVGGTSTYFARSTTAGKATHAPIHTVTKTIETTYTSSIPAAPPVTATVTKKVIQKPPAPPVEFSDGMYLVGTDIEPGEYKTTGPGTGGMCYWARLGDSGGANIIANNLTEGPTRVTAVNGEYLEISGCSFTRA